MDPECSSQISLVQRYILGIKLTYFSKVRNVSQRTFHHTNTFHFYMYQSHCIRLNPYTKVCTPCAAYCAFLCILLYFRNPQHNSRIIIPSKGMYKCIPHFQIQELQMGCSAKVTSQTNLVQNNTKSDYPLQAKVLLFLDSCNTICNNLLA